MSELTQRLPDDLERLVDPGLLRRPKELTVACYTFPHYHPSALNDRLYGPGWSEYVLMRGCRPWFPGHHQPRQPMLGELDEREPATWERYNALAADNGVDVFIWDWYWYGDEPVLHEALDEGFLRASNNRRLKFAVMWTNHPWPIWFPTVQVDGTNRRSFALDAPERPDQVWQSLSFMIARSEEHTSELQSLRHLVCRLLLDKKKSYLSTSSKTTFDLSEFRSRGILSKLIMDKSARRCLR